jgi:endonuclease/exonuclease/phosphatase family metal-dependent hydrolase
MRLKLLSWNVAGRSGKLAAQAAAVARQDADIIALQEVRSTTLPKWRKALAAEGLSHIRDSSGCLGGRRFFNLVAGRWPCRELPLSGAPYPERVLSVVAETPVGEIEVHNAHVPPAMRNGLIKVETFEAISYMLARPSSRPRILCGDFNSPMYESAEGEVVTAAERHPEWLERWDAGERSVLTGLAAYDLGDVFRRLHGYDRQDASWVFNTRARRKQAHRFDHVFASAALNAVHCDYHHEWRESGLSDHSAIEAVFEPSGQVG